MDEVEYAERFALEHAHYERDLGFWVAEARRSGGPVLDIGCAAGRVSVVLAAAGIEVCGLDHSQAMLDELSRAARAAGVSERIVAHRGDMRGFDLGRTFPLVIVPMNTFQLMHGDDDQRAALEAIARHLAPGGEAIIEIANPDFAGIARSIGELVPAGSFKDERRDVLLMHSSRYDSVDLDRRRATFTLRVDERASDGSSEVFLREFDVRLFTPEEFGALAERSGLELVESFGDFDGAPLTTGSELQLHRLRVAR